ncbi:MAG: UDP-N-acetylmuramoyl-tripeptide--D-alanyl-D-alanine ligase [Verrucomicrobia bacterium]|nr:UDP-N-acetylmuramoyl-tripeptide--D-alanyl-D-alanine ligase [Verrucomicrobiota bacterium]
MNAYNLFQIAHWLQIPVKKNGPIRSFQQDSRLVQSGDLFFALKGEKVDGHTYLKDVAAHGALAAVVSKDYQGDGYGLQLLAVDDVIEALQLLAKEAFRQRKCRVVGVTGSVGKTTTKEFAATLLEGLFVVGKTPGNANSQVGMPLSILNSRGDEQVFVMEMGMSVPHEIERLIDIAAPEIALVTKIALAHAAFFPDGLEGIARAKAEILSHPKTKLGVVNAQAMGFDPMQKTGTCQKISYGLKEEFPEADYVLEKVGASYQVIEKEGRSPLFKLPFAATHLCENFLGAAAVCRKMGMEWDLIIAQAQNLKVYKNRFELVEVGGVTFLNDSYNANATSMKAALRNLPAPQPGGKTIAVLGSMRELGKFCESSHRQVAETAVDVVDHLICIGNECKPMVDYFNEQKKSVEWMNSLSEVRTRVFSIAKSGDVVLLKGSNSHQLWKVLENC